MDIRLPLRGLLELKENFEKHSFSTIFCQNYVNSPTFFFLNFEYCQSRSGIWLALQHLMSLVVP